MSLANVRPGRDIPNEINVIIEIPERSEPVKYEIDKESGALFVDRFMATAMYYPANYGYVPQTLSEDGDPVDVLVLSAMPLIAGCVIPARPVGVLKMTDESGVDAKILAVPASNITVHYKNVNSYKDIVPHTLRTIEHFFEHYKDLEEGKWVKIDGWDGPEAARQEIIASIERHQHSLS